ncbi:MAG: hypothetical protein WCF78_01160 [archaeon]
MFKKLLKLELNEYIVKFVSIYHLLMAFMFIVFGLFLSIFNKQILTLMQSEVEPVGIGIFIVIGVFLLMFGIYSLVTGLGLWNYQNYGRIMLLIELYTCIVGTFIYLILGIFTLFVSWFLGVYLLIIVLFISIILFLTIYLFQTQKQIVSLFQVKSKRKR